jgi:hypothetical protein
MRPSGGVTPDMINFARNTSVYKIWADMIAYNSSLRPLGEHSFCGFAGRWDSKNYKLDHNAMVGKYFHNIRMAERVPEALAGAMGDYMYVACFETQEALDAFYKDVMTCE